MRQDAWLRGSPGRHLVPGWVPVANDAKLRLGEAPWPASMGLTHHGRGSLIPWRPPDVAGESRMSGCPPLRAPVAIQVTARGAAPCGGGVPSEWGISTPRDQRNFGERSHA